MTCPRDLLGSMESFLKRKEFIAVIGPRQSGKTTFLEILREHLRRKMKIPDEAICYVTFEDRRLLAQFEAEPVAFVRTFMPSGASRKLYLMIDEFQYAVEGGRKLKLIYDTMPDVKVIITGSSSLDIKAHVGKFMVGRTLSFHLYPFNFGEFLGARDKRAGRIYRGKSEQVIEWLKEGKDFKPDRGVDVFHEEMIRHYEEFCIWGGYPAIVLAEGSAVRKKLLADIYNNYIMKDIKTLLELATENNLYLLSQYLAAQVGNIAVYQNLSQAAHLDYRNIKKHLNILKETFVCREIRPFFTNRQKELTRNPKIFFMDMGFRNTLIENMVSLDKRPDAGAIAENSVFIRLSQLLEDEEKINFWRTKVGAEVDFVLHREGRVIPVEVRFSPFDRERISRSLASFIEAFKPERSMVLTKNYWGYLEKTSTKILFVPIYYL
ncbi:MAG: ATP-binding protein [Armatimonadetes bacterium]|nr:ATP-binding protein [Armatimonadota bacterium]